MIEPIEASTGFELDPNINPHLIEGFANAFSNNNDLSPQKHSPQTRRFLSRKAIVTGGGILLLLAGMMDKASETHASPSFINPDRSNAIITGLGNLEKRIGANFSPYFTEKGSQIEWTNSASGRPPNSPYNNYAEVRETVDGNPGEIWQINSTLKKADGTRLFREDSHIGIGAVVSGKDASNAEVAYYAVADNQNGTGFFRFLGKSVGSGDQYAFPTEGSSETEFSSSVGIRLEIIDTTPQKYLRFDYPDGIKRYILLDNDLRPTGIWKDTPPFVEPPTPTPTLTPTPTPTPPRVVACKPPKASIRAKQVDKYAMDMTLTAKGRPGGKSEFCAIVGADWKVGVAVGPNGSPPSPNPLYQSNSYPEARFTPPSPGSYSAFLELRAKDGQKSSLSRIFNVKPPKVRK